MSENSEPTPIDEVVQDTVDPDADDTTQREAVELELQDRGRSDEGEEVQVEKVVDESPAAGVLDDDRADPPEPSEPG